MMLKRIFFLALLIVSNMLFIQEITVMTYNIKYDNVDDTINNWNDRKADMVELLKHYEPGIIGMQEVLHHQLTYLDDNLPTYRSVGVGREDGKEKGEYSPILYDATKYRLVQSETFWLSETPEKISVGWDAALERICTYALFEDIKSGKQFWFFNTHFDHIGTIAREKSVELIVSKIKMLNTKAYPVVLTGDLNLTPDQKPIQYLQKELIDGKKITQKAFYGPSGTFSGFDPNKILDNRIDYIFVKNAFVESYNHIDDRMENNKHISDHLPVLMKLILN